MKRLWLIAAVFGICMSMVFCIGCEDETKTSKAPKVEEEPTAVAQAPQTTGQEETAAQPKPAPVTQSQTPPVDPAKAPVIVLDKMLADFGEVGGGTSKTVEIKISNAGKGPLQISRVDGCCGCSATLSGKTVAVGEEVTLKATCNFSSRPGTMRRTMYINSNDPNKPKLGLAIKAVIVQKISFEPTMLRLFLDRENAGCPEITVASMDGQEFSVTGFKATADAITADFDPAVKATKFVFQPKVDAGKLKAGLNGYVEITLTHPDAKSASIAFSALPEYKLSPPQVILFNAEEGKPIARKIWVLNNYEAEFDIESVSCTNGTIEVVEQREITNGYEFEVKITPPAKQANKTVFTDQFNIKIKDGEELSVPCRGFYLRKTN